jgi:hypothetical protein
MSKNQNAHTIHDSNLPQTFAEMAFKRDHPLEKVPDCGWVANARETTERGRKIIAADANARRGLRTFPPAREIVR